MPAEIGIVVIGRNEGERLRRCLASVPKVSCDVIYVDSGSTDGSVALARSLGADVVELDASLSFSAARARNEGFDRALKLSPNAAFVEFVDGDCELAAGWIERSVEEMMASPEAGVVCGRVRERHREASVYHRLCDMEWNTPTGEVDACGGIFMVRVGAFREAGGFDTSVVAGEEPELCLRLRQAGWRILRIGADMAVHDAAMTRFGQWWRRYVRCGYGYALGNAMHGKGPAHHWVRETRSNWLWGLVLPMTVLAGVTTVTAWSLLLLITYPMWLFKVARYRRRIYGDAWSDALLYGAFCMLGKLPMAWGQLRFVRDRLTGRSARLIEYRTSDRVEGQAT